MTDNGSVWEDSYSAW